MNREADNEQDSERTEALLNNVLVPPIALDSFYKKLESQPPMPVTMRGRVRRITGLLVEARLPNARIGELVSIEPPGKPPVLAQVVGFDDEDVYLTALDPLDEVGPKTPVINQGRSLQVPVGSALLGRVIDSLGKPLDGRGEIRNSGTSLVRRAAPKPMERRRITDMMPVGVRAIDVLLSIGEGQRMGVFSTAGVGKSSLLGMLSRNTSADVNVVALVGERGREVLDFLKENLGEEGLRRTVVVVATSDETPLRRILAAYTATAIAEHFRDEGKRVMLFMDSVTRFARALREIALSMGEPPARQGFPPSVFAALPELLERAGATDKGSITAFYTILLSSELIEDPLGEEIRAILDGHLYLSSRLSQTQHYPAIDPLKSNSRLFQNVTTPEHQKVANNLRRLWAVYEENRELISIGAYRKGTDAEIDEAIDKRALIREFLVQEQGENDSLEVALEKAARCLK